MNSENTAPTRRDVLKTSGGIAIASSFAGISSLYAADTSLVSIALVGCGGRGTGAAANALSTKQGPVQLVAMADAYKDKLELSFNSLAGNKRLGEKVKVAEQGKFIGFDAYKKAMDMLKPGDVVILATPPAFRWPMFSYAIEKGLNVFMEKPVAVDGPSCKKMFKLAEESVKKNLKVGVGLMCRHCEARGEMFQRIKDGAIGDLTLLRAYRMAGHTGNMPVRAKKPDQNELEYQIRSFHGFLWLSGGAYSDFLIHNIDECCWMKDAWPVEAKSSGGRHYREGWVDQNFDTYDTEFTFADGAKFFLQGRTIPGCKYEFASYCHGTKGSGIISYSSHAPSHASLFKTQKMVEKDLLWSWGPPENEPNPYQLEWEDLMKAIRDDKPYNEVKRGTEASLVTAMGRMAAHTGQIITRDTMLNCDHEFAPDVDKLVLGGEAPLKADADGKYPLPEPGKKTKREY